MNDSSSVPDAHRADRIQPIERRLVYRRRELDGHRDGRFGFESRQRVDGDESTISDDPHPVCHPVYLGEDVRGEKDGSPGITGLVDEIMELLLHEWVEP